MRQICKYTIIKKHMRDFSEKDISKMRFTSKMLKQTKPQMIISTKKIFYCAEICRLIVNTSELRVVVLHWCFQLLESRCKQFWGLD